MDTLFTHCLNTNYVPSDEEIPAIRDIIRKGEEALNDIDQETRRIRRRARGTGGRAEGLRRELPALAERREVQKRQVDEHKALLSPIKRVNYDILTSIFLSVLDVVDRDHLEISKKHPAVVISHVCQRWRETSLSTKLLWRHLHFRFPAYHHNQTLEDTWRAKLATRVQMARMWISRSGDCHLSVEILDLNSYSTFQASALLITECIEFNELVEVLCSSSPRWKDLYLEMSLPGAQFPAMRLLTVPPQPTPTLTNVKLYFYWRALPQQRSPLNQHFFSGTNILTAPTLRSFEINTQTLALDIKTMPVVWSSLEHLVLLGSPARLSHHFDAAQALELFKECPNLVTCCLVLERESTIPTDSAPIPLRRLRELSFLWNTSPLPTGFARSLILPALRKLVVYHEGAPRTHEESGLFEFFERFGSTLDNVTFCYTSLTQAALHHCLQHLPNVSYLGLVSSNRYPSIRDAAKLDRVILMHLSPQFDEAGIALTQSPLCPSIEVLRLSVASGRVDEVALVDFIESRLRGVDNQPVEGGRRVTRLRELDCGLSNLQAVEPMLRGRGIDVEVSQSRSAVAIIPLVSYRFI